MALQTRLAALQTTLKHDRNRAETLPDARKKRAQAEQARAAKAGEFATAWKTTLPEQSSPPFVEDALPLLPELAAKMQRQLDAKEEAGLRREGEATGLGNRIATTQHLRREAARQQADLLQKLDAAPDAVPDSLPRRLPELAAVTDAENSQLWQALWDEAKREVQNNRIRRQTQAQAIGVEEEPLNFETERQEERAWSRRLAVRQCAGETIARTRQAIVSNVMPRTTINMNRFLPLLTDGRYQEVQWEESQNALNVYDNQARAYRRKDVFSGGARDQISLALRLAFAIATLPGEHSVRPGWLFLDEPLSSFDRQRTLALVQLLTRGLIHSQFDQIFLISHSEAFEPGLFDFRIRMESGVVVESTLPTPPLLAYQ